MFSKKMVLVLAIFLLSCLLMAPLPNSVQAKDKAPDLTWLDDPDKGMDQARQMNRYVLADVYTNWCVPCKKMDRTTFADAGLRVFLADHFVCIKVNAEDKGAGQKFAESNKVGAFPCGLVFGPRGKLLGRVVGFKTASEYRTDLDSLIQGQH